MVVIKYRCKRCGYTWTYRGEPKYELMPCPICCLNKDVEIVEKKDEK